MTTAIILIFLWYIFTGIREGLTWKKTDSFFHIPKDVISLLLIPLSFVSLGYCLPRGIGMIWLYLLGTILFITTLISREYLDKTREKFLFWLIDYHTIRGIEGAIFFVFAWIIMKDLFLLSAIWLIGNWFYKRIMNYVLYGTFKHKMTMTTYWMFGYALPYSDRWYDWSLIIALVLLFL